MPGEYRLSIRNKLVKEKREINVYHHSNRSSHIISFNNTLSIQVETDGEEDNDYLHISPVKGPGYFSRNIYIQLPYWVDFKFSAEKEIVFTHISQRLLIRIPPGPPSWELKVIISTGDSIPISGNSITVGDDDLIKKKVGKI